MITRSKNKPITCRLRSSVRLNPKYSMDKSTLSSSSSFIAAKRPKKSNSCRLCFTGRRNDSLLGDLRFSSREVVVHKFCLYFSPRLPQNGNLLDNFWGFKHDDIYREVKRCSTIRCSYCLRRGASINCCHKNCKMKFHLPCGIENGSYHGYHDESELFPSYCHKHRPVNDVPDYTDSVACTICQELVERSQRKTLMYFKCCRSYFHSVCLKNLTFHQGELLLRCPNCNNKEEFIEQLKKGGFFIPQRGPSWGMSPQYAIDRMIYQCVALECNCPFGRMFADSGLWHMYCCSICGNNWKHNGCMDTEDDDFQLQWICEHCS